MYRPAQDEDCQPTVLLSAVVSPNVEVASVLELDSSSDNSMEVTHEEEDDEDDDDVRSRGVCV